MSAATEPPNPETPTGPAGPAPAPPARRRTWPLLAALALVVYVLDQVTKVLAVEHLEPGVPRPLLGEVLQLRLIRNPGAAFSLAADMTWVLTVIATAVVVVVLVLARRVRSRGWAVALGLLLAGGLGNLTDRLLRAPGVGRGHVVDFLQLPHWPIFNVADSSIVAAAVLIAVLGARGVGLDGEREGSRTATSGGAGA